MDNELYQKTIGAILSIIQVLAPLGGAFYAFYKAKGIEFIKSKIALIKDEKTRTLVNGAFGRVDQLLEDCIISAEHTLKQDIIKNIEEGRVNKDALREMGIDVANNVKNQLSDKTVDLLKYEITDIESYINDRLERKLAELKLDSTSPVSKTILPEVIVPVIDTSELENKNVQLQADKDNLATQVSNLQSNVDSLAQTNNSLVTERDNLNKQVTDLQNNLNTISNAVSQINPTV